MSRLLETAADRLRDAAAVLVVTGAGISAESGIPTFRGAGGLWEGYRAEELATPEAFARDPELVWRWYRWRLGICRGCDPNPGHEVVAAIERSAGSFLLATQNVDGLHRRAGSRAVVELHGGIDRQRCTACARVEGISAVAAPEDAPLPTCSRCGALARPHILWFGETYWPGVLARATAAAEAADVCLVVGTSAQIWPPVQLALHAQATGAFLIAVNPQLTHLSQAADVWLQGPGGDVLPALWELA